MVKLSNDKLIKQGNKYFKLKKYPRAIRTFYTILKSSSDENIKLKAYIGLADSLRAEYEIELAERMYNQAIYFAENSENIEIIKVINKKIKNIYVFKKERDLNPVQIGFFMRAIMKALSFLGKTDWF
ncbi:MAG: hypothetical protein ACFFCM_06110 [Promethearchaeota archaeon]